MHLEVLRAKVALSSEEHLNVLLGRVEDRGEVGGGHFDGLGTEGELLVGVEELCYRDTQLLEGRGLWDFA